METTLDRLLTPAEVAEYLGTTVGGLAQLRYKGTGPRFVKVNGTRVMYRQADLSRYLDERTYSCTDGLR